MTNLGGGDRVAPSVKHGTLDLRLVRSSPVLGYMLRVEPTRKKIVKNFLLEGLLEKKNLHTNLKRNGQMPCVTVGIF